LKIGRVDHTLREVRGDILESWEDSYTENGDERYAEEEDKNLIERGEGRNTDREGIFTPREGRGDRLREGRPRGVKLSFPLSEYHSSLLSV
jgi:hypothetical protein